MSKTMKFVKIISRLNSLYLPQLFIATLSIFIMLISISLIAYHFFYNDIRDDYIQKRRNIIQITCGRPENNERIYSLKPGICQFWNGEFYTNVSINKLGYRSVRQAENNNLPRLVVTGDSHAMGWGVNDGEDLSSLISLSGKYNVQNFSMSSYGTARELITLKKFAPHAQIIILQYCDNDLRENEAFINNPIQFKKEYKQRLEDFKNWKTNYEQYSDKNYSQRLLLNKLYGYLSSSWELMSLIPKAQPANNNMLEREAMVFAKTLGQFRNYLDDKIVLIFESNGFRALRKNFVSKFKKEIKQVGLKNIYFLDSDKILKSSDYYFIDDHLSKSGHKKIADQILQTIEVIPIK